MGARAGGPVRLRTRQTFAGRPVCRVLESRPSPALVLGAHHCVALSSVPWESSRGTPPPASLLRGFRVDGELGCLPCWVCSLRPQFRALCSEEGLTGPGKSFRTGCLPLASRGQCSASEGGGAQGAEGGAAASVVGSDGEHTVTSRPWHCRCAPLSKY